MPTPPNGQTPQTIHWLLLTNCLSLFDYFVGLMPKGYVYAKDICDLRF